MFFVMMIIPDQSGRVRRLRAYERELNHKLAFDSKFADDLTKRQSAYASGLSSSVIRRIVTPGSSESVVDNSMLFTPL
jgi:hypothetical protein